MLRETVEEAIEVIKRLSEEELLKPRRIQGFDVAVQGAIGDSVSHFGGHTQEIIWITRMRVGRGYKFLWQPTGREQGAED